MGIVKRRKLGVVSGVRHPTLAVLFTNNIHNLAVAASTRVLQMLDKTTNLPKPIPQPDPRAYNNMRWIQQSIVKQVNHSTPYTLDEFVESYDIKAKRDRYRRALDDYQICGYKPAFAKIKCKIKTDEKTKIKPQWNNKPRMISPRHPIYNILVGRHLKPIEHRIYNAVDHVWNQHFDTGSRTILKGINASDIYTEFDKKWNSFRNPRAVDLDGESFDSTVSVDALKFEHSVYNGICRDVEFAQLLKKQLHNKCSAAVEDGTMKYTTNGGRMSGDMNTGLGNCLIMSTVTLQLVHDLGIRAALGNNGDDCSLIIEADDVEKLTNAASAHYLKYGFVIKVGAVVDKLHQLEFCQLRPILTPEGGIMVRNIETCLWKDPLSCSAWMTNEEGKAWMAAVGTGGLSLAGGIPILDSFYRMMLRCADGVEPRPYTLSELGEGKRMLEKGMHRRGLVVDDSTRIQVEESWGISYERQVSLEEYYDNMVNISDIFIHPEEYTNLSTYYLYRECTQPDPMGLLI